MYVTESGNGGVPECTEAVTFFRIVECRQRKSGATAKRNTQWGGRKEHGVADKQELD
jgi:hypothetical protein